MHVFGVHTHCSTDFCTVRRRQQQSQQGPSEAWSTDSSDDEENCGDSEQDRAGDVSEIGHQDRQEDDNADFDGM